MRDPDRGRTVERVQAGKSRRWAANLRGLRPGALLAVIAAGVGALFGSGVLQAAASGSSVPPTPSYTQVAKDMKQWGFTPAPGSIPELACSDNSYANAVQNGVTYGTYSLKPYFYPGANGQPAGYEYDLLKAALNYAGITKIKIVYAPYDSLIPALTASRIDMFPAHETPERLKVIGFTAPVYWYGPGIVVPASNPAHITSYGGLTKAGVKVGVVTGSAAQLYMQRVHGSVVTYTSETDEFASLLAGRESAVLEDAPTIAAYFGAYPHAKLALVKTAPLDAATLAALGYSDFEWGIRKSECSLDLAVSRSLAVIRADGVVKTILQRAGMAGLAGTDVPGLAGLAG